jgi:hypothetical protein
MKFKVEVDETVWEVRTHIVEAESEEAARKNLLKGDGEGMIELTESFPDVNEITNIRAIERIEERS